MTLANGTTVAGALLALVALSAPGAGADLLDDVARTRAFAYETARIVRAARVRDAKFLAPTARPLSRAALADAAASGSVRADSRLARFHDLIVAKAQAYGLSPEFVAAVIRVESGFNPRALSPKGAQGLMQLMPGTAMALGVRDPWDAEENVDGGVRFLADLLWEFRDVRAALAAYNAGPEVVRKGRSLPAETRMYIDAVLHHFSQANRVRGGRP